MNKNALLLLFSLLILSCVKKKVDITKVNVSYSHTIFYNYYSVSLIKENDSLTMVHVFHSPTRDHGNDSLTIKKMFRIPTSEFNRIENLVLSIDEKNIRKELNRKGMDGSSTMLQFGDDINIKQYGIWSPEHHDGESLKKYMKVNKEIFKLGGFDPSEVYFY